MSAIDIITTGKTSIGLGSIIMLGKPATTISNSFNSYLSTTIPGNVIISNALASGIKNIGFLI